MSRRSRSGRSPMRLGTVEDAIQRMHARKQGLADGLLGGTGRWPLAMTGEDIDALFGSAQTASPAGP